MKTPATENEYNKLNDTQPQIEKPDDTENKIKNEERKQSIIRELAKKTNTDMKGRVTFFFYYKNKLMQINLANYAIENQKDFKPNLTFLNKIIHVSATVISSITIIHK